MAGLAAIVLLALILEHNDLLALALLQHLTGNGGAGNHGIAHFNGVPTQHQHGEGDFVVHFVVQLFHIDDVSLRDTVLFAAGSNNRIHSGSTSSYRTRRELRHIAATRQRRRAFRSLSRAAYPDNIPHTGGNVNRNSPNSRRFSALRAIFRSVFPSSRPRWPGWWRAESGAKSAADGHIFHTICLPPGR